jgi:hypothetical protein
MRPLTVVLLIIVAVIVLFFGYSIYTKNKTVSKIATTVANTSNEKQNFKLKVNSNSVWINGKETVMDSPVREINGKTLVPVKFLLDFLKAENVNYDAKTEEVTFDLEIPIEKVPKIETTSQTTQTNQQTEDSLLTKEKRDKINSTAFMSATSFKINTIESDGFTITIKIDLLMEPKTIEEVKKISDTFANDVSFIFDTKHDIKIVAIRKDPGKDTYKTYGTSRFRSNTGKIEFSEEINK